MPVGLVSQWLVTEMTLDAILQVLRQKNLNMTDNQFEQQNVQCSAKRQVEVGIILGHKCSQITTEQNNEMYSWRHFTQVIGNKVTKC